MSTLSYVPVIAQDSIHKTLMSGDVSIRDCAAPIFGELVKLASPVVTHYHSDLYHDALWLNDQLVNDPIDGKFTFFYVVRDFGTHVSLDEDLLNYAVREGHLTYIVSVWKDEKSHVIFDAAPVDIAAMKAKP